MTNIEKIITAALAIEDESAQDAGRLGFMARAMVQATLPHRKVDGNEFERVNGDYTLNLLAPSKIGLPYGTVPRLLLAWITTEAVRTQSRELELGDSLSGFMRELGLAPTGGRWGSIGRLKDQAHRLFSCTISARYKDNKMSADIGYRLAERQVLWWDDQGAKQPAGFTSSVKLSDTFYSEVIAHPVPIDIAALNALKQSPLALDIYCWLTYRASYLKKPSTVPWEGLAMQFGSNYKLVRQFKAAFIEELRKVFTVYAGLRVEATDEGLIVKPMTTHVSRKSYPQKPG